MIDKKKLIEAITERIKRHESDADLFKGEPIVFNMEEMLLRIADEGNAIIELVESQPTVEAVPVVHGRWAHLGGDEWCCTNCGNVLTTEGSWERPTKKYCDECGAKMDKED